MDMKCPKCMVSFGFLGTNKAATVLPCGDTYCSQCIQNETITHYEFPCLKCGAIINSKQNMPINKLFYQMQVAFKQYQARRQYENPTEPMTNDLDRFNVNYDEKCMNQFCTKLRFRNESINELFCSKNCKEVHQQMYN